VTPSLLVLAVRWTARVSAGLFASALLAFTIERARGWRPRSSLAVLVSFLVVHTIHFGVVLALASATLGENIRRRGGWVPMALVGVLFYLASLALLRAWYRQARGLPLGRAGQLGTQAGVPLVGLIFFQAYATRARSSVGFALFAALLVFAVAAYFWPARRHRQSPDR
jgi:hypothetical protein